MRQSPKRRFAYRLAAALGILEVEARIIRGTTAKQFRLWEIYDSIEPVGGTRLDILAAQITAMIFNMAVDKKHRKPIADFILRWDGKTAEEKMEELPKMPDGTIVTEQVWIAMNIAAMNAAEMMSPGKVDIVDRDGKVVDKR